MSEGQCPWPTLLQYLELFAKPFENPWTTPPPPPHPECDSSYSLILLDGKRWYSVCTAQSLHYIIGVKDHYFKWYSTSQMPPQYIMGALIVHRPLYVLYWKRFKLRVMYTGQEHDKCYRPFYTDSSQTKNAIKHVESDKKDPALYSPWIYRL